MDSDTRILHALIAQPEGYVNGQDLAEQLGMSRVGIWKRLQKLSESGLQLTAVRNRGYRITREPEQPLQSLMNAWLYRENVSMPVHWHASIGSTNTEAQRLLAEGSETPFAVASAEQTQGRGRMGRRWHSPSDGNLYISFAFQPSLPPKRMQTITLFFGLRLCIFMNQRYGLPVQIKWPNDLLLNGKKVCGMLTEARVDADAIRDLIFGMGLNINCETSQWPEEVRRMATSLRSVRGERLPFHRLTAELTGLIEESYQHFLRSDTRQLLKEWPDYDCLHGRTLNFERNQKTITGVGEGIDTQGCLLIREASGKIHALNAGEVSIGSGNLE
ncbi:MAG: biotin--[acetyl-CoA-carboxylase] ligase [Opitutales bacterium]|nr:biotin--[acetyl-CoA-carboxylase] ligase [Opitutales bacterium]